MRECENNYIQVIGGIEELKKQKAASFDAVVCHNVLEYALERQEIVKEFVRVLKPNGIMSIIKHNHVGRVMQKVVFENNVDEAILLLDGGDINVMNFGKVHYYDTSDIIKWDNHISIEKILGLRTFWALQQNNGIKSMERWQERMFEIEMKVSEMEVFKNICIRSVRVFL